VVGWPIAHSLSPLIHTIWAKRAGLNAYYVPVPVEPDYDSFARAMDSLRTIGFQGVNVTIPHKEHALRYADHTSPYAHAAGAANMMTFRQNKAYADNSDIHGFRVAMTDAGASGAGRAVVLGAGGAARGVVNALKGLGYLNISIANRTHEKAERLAERFELEPIDWEERSNVFDGVSALVNTTSLGMTGEPPLDLDLSNLNPETIVADIVYTPLETPLLKQARAKGCKTVDGLSMLMHQAVPGFETWLGGKAVVDDDLRQHLVSELKRREKT
jgi:shikimate dehydrogenase